MSELPETFVQGFHNEDAVRKMKYNKFGNTGMSVSEISLGAAGFSALFGDYTFEQCKATVIEALKSGINYIDTAPWYGQGVSEEILGKCLEGIPRKAYYIATKVARYEKDPKLMFDFSAKKTKESIETSLKKLKLDYVDVIQIHDIDFAPSLKIVVEETLPALQEAVDQGKSRFIGVTSYLPSVLEDCVKQSTVTINTILCYARLNMLNNTLKEYIPFFKSKNVAIINAAVHCQGMLSNGGPQNWHYASQDIKDACTEAREYCKSKNVELGRLALYYSLHEEGANTVLIGVNNPELLKSNLDVYFNGVTENEKQISAHIKNTILSKLKRTDWEQAELDWYWNLLKT